MMTVRALRQVIREAIAAAHAESNCKTSSPISGAGVSHLATSAASAKPANTFSGSAQYAGALRRRSYPGIVIARDFRQQPVELLDRSCPERPVTRDPFLRLAPGPLGDSRN